MRADASIRRGACSTGSIVVVKVVVGISVARASSVAQSTISARTSSSRGIIIAGMGSSSIRCASLAKDDLGCCSGNVVDGIHRCRVFELLRKLVGDAWPE